MSYYFRTLRYQYADFEGRTRRRDYWRFMLIHLLIVVLTQFVISLSEAAIGGKVLAAVLLLLSLWLLGTLIPVLALIVRRLHDIGRSGWWVLANFIPFIGGLIVLIWSFVDSEAEPNEWGDDPKRAERRGQAGAASAS